MARTGPEQLYENRDLALTTDFRDVLGELVTKQLGNRRLTAVFPNFAETKYRGIYRFDRSNAPPRIKMSMRNKTFEYKLDGKTFKGYLALNEAQTGSVLAY